MAAKKQPTMIEKYWRVAVGNVFSCAIGLLSGTVIHASSINKQYDVKPVAETNATMTVSAYAATDFQDKVATGTIGKVGRDVAVSPDRLDLLGKKIYIPGIGVREVTDVMPGGPKQWIDVLVPDKKCAKEFGKRHKEVYVIK